MRYRTVLLDAGDTLVGPRVSFGEVYARVFRTLGLDHPAEVFERGLRATWAELNATIPPGADRYRWFGDGEEGYWRRFVAGTLARTPGAPADGALATAAVEPLRDAFLDPGTWIVFPDVVPALDALRDAGARLAVVSNWDSRLPRILDRVGLASRFDAIVVSHLEGVEKPDAAIFRRALERVGGEPRDAIHVGDLPEYDRDGARAAGLAWRLVDRRARLAASHGAMADLAGLPRLAIEGR